MKKQLTIIHGLLIFIMAGLFISGLTAIPIEPQLSFLLRCFPLTSDTHHGLFKVLTAYREVETAHPFLLYGYDWLAFAHFILALLLLGPYRDPVRNIWVIQFGLIACALVFPLAFIAGAGRGIPPGWQLIDCSFGAAGAIPLWICYRKTRQLSLNPHYSTK